jgi:hypothetical protein
MRSVIAFLVCTGFIVWAHSSDTRIVGLKVYVHKPTAPVFKKEVPEPEIASTRPVLFAHYIHTVYLDTISISARRVYPD